MFGRARAVRVGGTVGAKVQLQLHGVGQVRNARTAVPVPPTAAFAGGGSRMSRPSRLHWHRSAASQLALGLPAVGEGSIAAACAPWASGAGKNIRLYTYRKLTVCAPLA